MAKLLKLRRGTTSQHSSFTGAEGEVTVDTDKETLVVHDGSTAGGHSLARQNLTNVSSATIAGRLSNDSIAVSKIAAGTLPSDVKIQDANVSGNLTIANADINADAIDGSKIADDSINSEHYVDGSIDAVHIASSAVTTSKINTNAVDLNKIQTIITDTFLGRTTNGTGNVEVLSAASARGILNVEDGATADQTAAEIRTLVESASDSNVFTDADHSKLNGIEASATADQTAAEIRTLVESASDSNVFTDADHSKLNGIESGATADQTKSDIDGLNINADQVDSLHASSFLRSDADDSGSGSYSFTNSYNEFGNGTGSVSNDGGWNGRVNIAGSNHARLDVKSVSDGIIGSISAHNGHSKAQIGTRSNHGIGFICNSSEKATLDTSGNFIATGNVTAYSDARLKTNISTINDALGICGKLRGVSYKWLRDGSDGIGVIAQEVEQVIPSVVVTSEVEGLDGMEEVKSVVLVSYVTVVKKLHWIQVVTLLLLVT